MVVVGEILVATLAHLSRIVTVTLVASVRLPPRRMELESPSRPMHSILVVVVITHLHHLHHSEDR